MTATERHTAGRCTPAWHCGCLFAMTDAPMPDRLIEATMRTVVGRIFWAVLSLAVIYACGALLYVAVRAL